jgi:hypothetical protein
MSGTVIQTNNVPLSSAEPDPLKINLYARLDPKIVPCSSLQG